MIQKTLLILSTAIVLALSGNHYATKEYTITGKIKDVGGQPLIGVSIVIKGTTTGAVSDIDGSFTLIAKDSCTNLVISIVGFKTVNMQVCNGEPISIILNELEVELNELIVIGYSSKSHENYSMVSSSKVPNRRNSNLLPAPSVISEKRKKREINIGYDIVEIKDDEYPNREPFSTENYGKIEENKFKNTKQAPLSTFSIDVDAASYSNLRRFIEGGQIPPIDAVRIEEMINYFDYDYPQPKGNVPFSINTEVGECPWEPKHRLVHIGLQGKDIPTAELPASNLVFLIDVSGSMGEPNKLPLLKSSFKLLVANLRAIDKIALVVYAGAAGVVLPPTPGNEKGKIIRALDDLEAGGSTAGGEGIELAYQLAKDNFMVKGNNRVILATDGDFNVGTSSEGDLVRLIENKRKSGVFLTVMGFGTGNYQDDKMQQLADKGNGNHAYIDNLSEARKVLVNEFGGTLFTIAKDVKLQLEFNPAKVAGYRLIGYENRMLADEDFKDDTKDAGELGSGHTVTAIYEIIPVGVESKFLGTADELRYQQWADKNKTQNTDELLTIKFRYKAPDGDKSSLIEEIVMDKNTRLDHSSDNFRWSAAVAEFGMLLHKSIFKGDASYAKCIKLAEGARGKDTEGYRREMIKLLEMVSALDKKE